MDLPKPLSLSLSSTFCTLYCCPNASKMLRLCECEILGKEQKKWRMKFQEVFATTTTTTTTTKAQ